MQKLTYLNLSHNQIRIDYYDGRPWPLLTSANLRVLDLSFNLIEDFNEPLINGLPNLTILNLNHNLISFFISAVIRNNSNLRTLSLNNNKISIMIYLPDTSTVTELNLFGNNFNFCKTSVPIFSETSLTTLRLGRPGLTYNPSSFKRLSLQSLHIRDFSQHRFAAEILDKQLYLVDLTIENGVMDQTAVENKSFLRKITFFNLPNLKTFVVNNCTSLGSGIVRLRNVTNLSTIDIHKVTQMERRFLSIFSN